MTSTIVVDTDTTRTTIRIVGTTVILTIIIVNTARTTRISTNSARRTRIITNTTRRRRGVCRSRAGCVTRVTVWGVKHGHLCDKTIRRNIRGPFFAAASGVHNMF
jgi:hypothetical protein